MPKLSQFDEEGNPRSATLTQADAKMYAQALGYKGDPSGSAAFLFGTRDENGKLVKGSEGALDRWHQVIGMVAKDLGNPYLNNQTLPLFGNELQGLMAKTDPDAAKLYGKVGTDSTPKWRKVLGEAAPWIYTGGVLGMAGGAAALGGGAEAAGAGAGEFSLAGTGVGEGIGGGSYGLGAEVGGGTIGAALDGAVAAPMAGSAAGGAAGAGVFSGGLGGLTSVPSVGLPDAGAEAPIAGAPDLPGSGDTGIPQPPLDPTVPSVPSIPSLPDWLPDWAKAIPASVWSAGLQGVLGYLGADAKGDALKDIYNQQSAVGAPFREKLQQSYSPNFNLWNQPGYGDAFDRAGEVAARSAGVRGNPGTTPSLQGDVMKSVWSDTYLPSLANYRGQLGQFGGMGLNTAGVAGLAGADFSSPWLTGLGTAAGGLFGNTQNQNPQQTKLTIGGNVWGS